MSGWENVGDQRTSRGVAQTIVRNLRKLPRAEQERLLASWHPNFAESVEQPSLASMADETVQDVLLTTFWMERLRGLRGQVALALTKGGGS